MVRQSAGGALGRELREWRKRRGLTQSSVAVAVNISEKHLSFIETGRSGVGRDTLSRLIKVLNLPPAQGDLLMRKAGYSDGSALELIPDYQENLNDSVEQVFCFYEPFPAYVLDARLNVLAFNKSAEKLLESLAIEKQFFSGQFNLLLTVAAQAGLRPYLHNWAEVLRILVWRLRWSRDTSESLARDRHLEQMLRAFPDVDAALRGETEERALFGVNNVVIRFGDRPPAEFTHMMTSFNGPLIDGRSSRYNIEAFLPGDQAARKLVSELFMPDMSRWGGERQRYYAGMRSYWKSRPLA